MPTNNPTSWTTLPADRRIIHNHHHRLSLKNLLSDDVQSNQTESTQGSPDVFCTPAYLAPHHSRRSNYNHSQQAIPPSSAMTTTSTTLASTIARACYRRSHHAHPHPPPPPHPSPAHPLRVRSSLSVARETVTSRAASVTRNNTDRSQTTGSINSSSNRSSHSSREASVVGPTLSRPSSHGVVVASGEVVETSLSGAAPRPQQQQQRCCPRSHSTPVKCPAPRRRWSSRSLPENDNDDNGHHRHHDNDQHQQPAQEEQEKEEGAALHPNDLENLQRLYDRRTWDMYFRITEARARQRESHEGGGGGEAATSSETTLIPNTAGRNEVVPIDQHDEHDDNDDDDNKDVSNYQGDYLDRRWNPENDPTTDDCDDDGWKFNHHDPDSDDPAVASIYCSVSYDSQGGQYHHHHNHELIFGDLED